MDNFEPHSLLIPAVMKVVRNRLGIIYIRAGCWDPVYTIAKVKIPKLIAYIIT